MKPTAEDERAAKELISEWEQVLHRASTDDAHTDLLNRIASMRASEREKAAKIADGEREKSAALWERAANLPVKDTSAMKVYNGRQLAAGDIARTIRAGDKE